MHSCGSRINLEFYVTLRAKLDSNAFIHMAPVVFNKKIKLLTSDFHECHVFKKWLECRLDPDIDKNTVVTKMYKKQNTQKVVYLNMTDML